MMTSARFIFSGLLLATITTSASAQDACDLDVLTCPGGTILVREPPECNFPECPGAVCSLDIFVCPNGDELVRDPANNCEFPECTLVECGMDIFLCPDGLELVRDPGNNCEFPQCPPAVCGLDIFICPNGDELIRDPANNCDFPTCPGDGACPLDVFTCPNGEVLVRDPANNCDFPACPGDGACPSDVFTCPSDGTVLIRDPANNCDFPACPPMMCTLDVLTCPDGEVVSRDPANDCEFYPCSTTPTKGDYFMLAAATDGCIGRPVETAGDELNLMECNEEDDNVMWRLDEDGRFHSKVSDDECMQAGQRPELLLGVDEGLMQGSELYIKNCDGILKAPFQEFDDMWAMGGMTGPLTLEERPDLCVVHFGDTPDVGADRILLVECDLLGGDEGRVQGWTAIYPTVTYSYVTLEAKVGGCVARKDKGRGGDELFLKLCSSDDDNIQWRLDGQNRFRSKVNDAECIQAGEAPALQVGIGALKQGTDLYVKMCDGPLKPDFQVMTFPELSSVDPSGPVTAVVSLASRQDLCVVHFGADPSVDESRIMLADCASLGGDRGMGWEVGSPCMHAPFCEVPANLAFP